MRPHTQGCTELSCIYHGGDNQFKRGHPEPCPIRSYDGFVLSILDEENDVPQCTCEKS